MVKTQRSSIVVVLNRFLALEKQQVALYRRQASRTGDEHLRRALELFAEIEAVHVKNLHREIKRYGSNDGLLAKFTDNLGTLLGQATQVTGIVPMLKVNILIEAKAARDYAGFLATLSPGPTRELLWRHQIEEELHRAWMKDYLHKRYKEGKE